MDHIDKYKRVEEDQIQSKGKAKLYPEKKDLRGMGYQGSRPRRDFPSRPLPAETPLVTSLFKELVHHILEKIRDEPYFRQPNKMSGDASLRNQNLHCHYHQDKGHTIEECRMLHDHLNQLAKAGKLNHFLSRLDGQVGHQGTRMYHGYIPLPALGTINVILAQPRREAEDPSRIMSVHSSFGNEVMEGSNQLAKRMRFSATPVLGFSEEDKEGTCQPHDDALLKEEDLEKYDSPLVGFDGKQIPMSLSDQEKTSFHALNGNYHYRVMPFGLKNAGSTYQRMVTRMFELQLGHNMEAYINDMVIKSKKVGDHLRDLQETFSVLRRYKLRLNASKCSF
ncbi:uncharacterized protein LOC142631971 [Castanea sativa]|uniref:uncharacterized protein LOC142631971 n=1 Tax=Castanea sativa TaxID=21020 RepID=UPI003F650145